jgi:DNA polymerase
VIAGQVIPAGPGFATVLPDLDFETYSEAGYIWDGKKWQGMTKTQRGLSAVGAAVYSEHPSTEVLSLAYDLKDGRGPRLWVPGCAPPEDLFDHIRAGGLLEAHNSGFEFYIWQNVCQARMGWPALPFWQLRCSMAKARANSLPGKLGDAAAAIGAPEQKDPKGEALLRKLSVPRNPTKNKPETRITPEMDPDAFGQLYAYNLQDIKAEAALSVRCPDLLPRELELWILDQAINTRGVYIDQEALADCINIVNQAFDRYTVELQEITFGTVQTAGELQKIQGWLGANGVRLSNLDADAVETALKRDDLPPACRRVLEIRASLGAASVKKLFAIERRVSRDGRLRDLFAFCGADRTGRWAGRGPQPQNLPSSGPDVVRCPACGVVFWAGLLHCRACGALRGPDCKADWGIEAVEAALVDIASRDLARVEAQWGDAVAAVSGCLRGLFAAAPGWDLICSDFSAIEAVVLAELAGEEWRQEVFRTHGKIYEMSASKITGIPFEDFAKYKKETGQHHPMRKKVGKVAELASGYGGGLGAWKAFGADEFMTDDEIRDNVKAWREASPAVKAFWYGLQDAAFMAVQNPGHCYSYQAPRTAHGQPPAIIYGVKDDILYCRLPSGRNLTYHAPRLEPDTDYYGRPTLRLTYMGWNSDYKKGPIGWTRLDTWGGKLTENVVQAVSRDLLAFAMPPLERAGYPIVLHVHDEIVSEVPAGSGDVAEFEKIMSTVPAWAEGWPVKAAGGWRGKRYRKD